MEDRLVTFYKHTVFWPERNFMNTDKYKSVTVPLNTWKDLKKLADKDLRSISNQIVWLVNKHKEKKNLRLSTRPLRGVGLFSLWRI